MAKRKKVTKGEMVRQAIEAGAAMPQEGVAWIKENHGVTMKPNNFSNFKTMLTKGGSSSVGRKPNATSSVAKKPGAASSSVARKPGRLATRGHDAGNGVVALDDLRTLKEIVTRVGAAGVVEAVGLLGGATVGNG